MSQILGYLTLLHSNGVTSLSSSASEALLAYSKSECQIRNSKEGVLVKQSAGNIQIS